MSLSDFTGARRIPLVGRQRFLDQARQHLRQGGAHLLCFEGDGGIGKTALLEAIMERSRLEGRARVRYTGRVADETRDQGGIGSLLCVASPRDPARPARGRAEPSTNEQPRVLLRLTSRWRLKDEISMEP